MSSDEIEAIIAAYGESAANAKAVGSDGLENSRWPRLPRRSVLLAGHQSARRHLGSRPDAFRHRGGEGLPRPSDRTFRSLRWSQWKIGYYAAKLADSPKALEQFLAPLADAGVDIFHCSTRRFWEPEFEGSDLTLAGWTKKLSGKTVITVGSVGLDIDHTDRTAVATPVSIGKLEDMLSRGDFDLVAVGRALLADPNWLEKVRTGRNDEMVPFSYALQDTLI